MHGQLSLPRSARTLLDWLGTPEVQLVVVVFGAATIGLGVYGYHRGHVSRSEGCFVLASGLAWIAIGIESVPTILSVPQFVGNLLAGLAGLSFVGVFLYWAHNRGDWTDD